MAAPPAPFFKPDQPALVAQALPSFRMFGDAFEALGEFQQFPPDFSGMRSLRQSIKLVGDRAIIVRPRLPVLAAHFSPHGSSCPVSKRAPKRVRSAPTRRQPVHCRGEMDNA